MNQVIQFPIITIDGLAGTGKGTISSMLAQQLGYHLLDSGLLYRLVAYAKLNHPDCDIKTLLASSELTSTVPCRVFYRGHDVTEMLRTELYSQASGRISQDLEIRRALIEKQRSYAKPPGLIADGRDMATVIFPNATWKVFLKADIEIRAQRRYQQMTSVHVNYDQVLSNLKERDHRDAMRTHADPSSICIDTTQRTPQEVVDAIFIAMK